jgi:hypothetical protein
VKWNNIVAYLEVGDDGDIVKCEVVTETIMKAVVFCDVAF